MPRASPPDFWPGIWRGSQPLLTAMLFSTEIQKLVLEGRVGEAIETTQRFYPGLLEHNPNLLFMLK